MLKETPSDFANLDSDLFTIYAIGLEAIELLTPDIFNELSLKQQKQVLNACQVEYGTPDALDNAYKIALAKLKIIKQELSIHS